MAASYNDSFLLSQDTALKGRVQQALLTQFGNVASENATTTPFHRERMRFVVNNLSSPTNLSNAVSLFTFVTCANATVLSDATQSGTVVITSGNSATQAALITDAHIDNAISSQVNTFILEPAS